MTQVDLSSEIGAALPYLRRYSRALTGSQTSGDSYAAATLEAVLADRSMVAEASGAKAGLFKVFHGIWVTTGAPTIDEDDGPRAAAQRHLQKLTTNSREALLLHTIEDFSVSEVGEIMQIGDEEASQLIDVARQEMADQISGRVLIIEDEAIIAMDLESIVADLGHRVTGGVLEVVQCGRREHKHAAVVAADRSRPADPRGKLHAAVEFPIAVGVLEQPHDTRIGLPASLGVQPGRFL